MSSSEIVEAVTVIKSTASVDISFVGSSRSAGMVGVSSEVPLRCEIHSPHKISATARREVGVMGSPNTTNATKIESAGTRYRYTFVATGPMVWVAFPQRTKHKAEAPNPKNRIANNKVGSRNGANVKVRS